MGEKRKKGSQPLSDKLADESRTLRQQGRGAILSDVLGSYTGTAEHGERPEQDADDL